MPIPHAERTHSGRTCTQSREQSMPCKVGVGLVAERSAVCTCVMNTLAVPLTFRVAMLFLDA